MSSLVGLASTMLRGGFALSSMSPVLPATAVMTARNKTGAYRGKIKAKWKKSRKQATGMNKPSHRYPRNF